MSIQINFVFGKPITISDAKAEKNLEMRPWKSQQMAVGYVI